MLLGALVLGPLIWGIVYFSSNPNDAQEGVLTFKVANRDLIDTVIERGTLESQSKVQGVCELHGWQNKITFIIEEGASVEKGDVVVKFDSSEIERDIAEQKVTVTNEQAAVDDAQQQLEVQKNKNSSDIAAARLEKELAELDLKKYRDGDYKAELADIERSIAESEASVEQTTEEFKNMRVLVKKGYREPERLRQMEQAAKSAQFQLERDVQKKEVLTKFTYQRQITELESKAEEAGRKLERAIATAKAELAKAELALKFAQERLKIEQQELKEEEEQLGKAVIKAPHPGTVAYANSRWMSPDNRIRPGGTVHRQQTVFHLPDMSRMQVQVDIHESLINKLKIGQRALIRVSSFPDHRFTGKLHKVADLASSDRNTDTKTYSAIILIDSFPDDVKLKPGMNAEVEIHIRTLKDVAAIPVQTVTQIAGSEFVYVKKGSKFERTPVKVAEGNESFLVLKEGPAVGAVIAMDAYQRGLVDIEAEGLERPKTDESEFGSSDESDSTDEPAPSIDGQATGVNPEQGNVLPVSQDGAATVKNAETEVGVKDDAIEPNLQVDQPEPEVDTDTVGKSSEESDSDEVSDEGSN